MAIRTINLVGTGVTNLGDAREGVVSSWVLSVSGTFVGSITLRRRIRGGAIAAAAAPACWYTNAITNTAIAAGTAITAAGLYVVQADASDIVVDFTYTSGSLTLEADIIIG